jgi:hypothetical protein
MSGHVLVLLLLALCALAAVARGESVRDPYEVLQVSRRASAAEIKRAHRQLVLKWHPDKQPDGADKDDAAERFMAVQSAFEILSDDAKRRNFDAFGHPDGPFARGAAGDDAYHGSDHYHEFARWARASSSSSQQQRFARPIESDTPTLSLDDWYAVLANSTDDVWLVQFYAEGFAASYAFANAWEATAQSLSYCVRAARVHHNDHTHLAGEAGLEHVPGIVAIVDQTVHVYGGDPSSRFQVSAWLTQVIPDVATRVNSAAERRAFDAAEADRVRLYFFTDSPHLSLAMRWAAFHYRRDVRVAVVARATCADFASLAREFGVASLPTLLLQRGQERVQKLAVTPKSLAATLDKARYQRVPVLRQHRLEPLCGSASARACIVFLQRGADTAKSLLTGGSSGTAAFAAAMATLSEQQRAVPSARGGAPLIVWLTEADEPAFVRHFAAEHQLIALRVGERQSAYVGGALGELRAMLLALSADGDALLRADTLSLAGRVADVTRVAALPSLSSDATWSDWAQRKARALYRWVAHTFGLSTIFTLLIVTYSFWGVCFGRRNQAHDDAMRELAAAEEALRATGILPSGRDWLIEARARVSRGERFDSFGQLEELVRTLKPAHSGPAFRAPGALSVDALLQLHQRGFQFCVVLLEREPALSPIAAEHHRFLTLKSMQCKAMYHTQFAIAQLNVHEHAGACLLLQALNESTRRPSATAAPARAASADGAQWDTLPKLMAVNIAQGAATFFRGPSVRSSLCSDWLEQLVRNRLNEVAQWVNIVEIVREASPS